MIFNRKTSAGPGPRGASLTWQDAPRLLGLSWKNFSFLYIFLGIFIIYAIVNPYLTWGSTINVLTQSVVWCVIGLGMGLIIITGDIDLSVGSNMAFSGGLSILIYQMIVGNNQAMAPWGTLVILLLTVTISAAIGFLNGFMVGKLKMPAFIATLGTMLIFRSLGKYTRSQTLGLVSTGEAAGFIYSLGAHSSGWLMYDIGNYNFDGIFPVMGILCIIIVALAWFFSKYTKMGRRFYAIGSNPQAAQLAGINVGWNRVLVFTIAGALVGLASFFFIAYSGSIDSNASGTSYELYTIASCIIGGISMTGGKGNLVGVLFGAMSFTLIDKIIAAVGLDPLINDTIKGAILLIAVILQLLKLDSVKAMMRNVQNANYISHSACETFLKELLPEEYNKLEESKNELAAAKADYKEKEEASLDKVYAAKWMIGVSLEDLKKVEDKEAEIALLKETVNKQIEDLKKNEDPSSKEEIAKLKADLQEKCKSLHAELTALKEQARSKGEELAPAQKAAYEEAKKELEALRASWKEENTSLKANLKEAKENLATASEPHKAEIAEVKKNNSVWKNLTKH